MAQPKGESGKVEELYRSYSLFREGSIKRKELARKIRIFIERNPIHPDSSTFKELKGIYDETLGNGHLFIIKLDVTNRCNLNCIYCYSKKDSAEMDRKHIFRLADSFRHGRIELMGGEPMIRKDIFEIISHIKSRGLTCTLFTNGTLISADAAKKLKGSELDHAIVSLISDKKEVHDEITEKKGSFEKTVDGIKNLVAAGIRTYAITVVNSANVRRLKEINEFSKGLGARNLHFKYVPRQKDDPLMLENTGEWGRAKKWALYEKSPAHGDKIRNVLALTGRSCQGGYSMVSVKTNGDVTPCPFIHHDLVLGNIKDRDINKIFGGRHKNLKFNGFFSPAKECGKCSIVDICGGGCKTANKVLHGDYMKKDALCQGPWSTEPDLSRICELVPSFW